MKLNNFVVYVIDDNKDEETKKQFRLPTDIVQNVLWLISNNVKVLDKSTFICDYDSIKSISVFKNIQLPTNQAINDAPTLYVTSDIMICVACIDISPHMSMVTI